MAGPHDRVRLSRGPTAAPSKPPPSSAPEPGTPPSLEAVVDRYDLILFDLDGVVYRGVEPVPGAAEVLAGIRRRGRRIMFVTNNSSRTPRAVSEVLRAMGIEASPDEVLTSGRATASMLVREGLAGASAYVIGERGVREALADAGIAVLDGLPSSADLVVVGWDRAVDYAMLRQAALLVERGARLIATNADASYPAPDGLWPGAGAILAAVTTTTGATPVVVGKPHRPLFEAALDATGARRPLMVGDRIDTDVAGARAMGWDSLLVLTGASSVADLPHSDELPAYLGTDLHALLDSTPRAKFRPAEAADLADIQDLLDDCGLTSQGLEGRLSATLVCPARSGGDGQPSAIAATACIERVDPSDSAIPGRTLDSEERRGPESNDGPAVLRSVAVHRSHRGKGLGVLLVAHVVRMARTSGFGRIYLFTDTARAFFERLGFTAISRDSLPPAVGTSRQAQEECAETADAMVLAQ